MRMVSWSLWRTMGRRVGSQARGGSHQEDGMPDVMGNVFTCRDLDSGDTFSAHLDAYKPCDFEKALLLLSYVDSQDFVLLWGSKHS